jgi:hypothetical protein
MNGGIYYPSRVDPQVVGSLVMEPLSKSKVKGATLGSTFSIRMHGSAWVFLFAGLGITRERCGCPSIEPYPENLSAWGHSPHDTEVHPTIQMGSAYWGNDISILRCVIKYVRASAYLIICNTYYTCTYLSMGWFKENFTGTPPDFMGKNWCFL